jgi:hypothetical protein
MTKNEKNEYMKKYYLSNQKYRKYRKSYMKKYMTEDEKKKARERAREWYIKNRDEAKKRINNRYHLTKKLKGIKRGEQHPLWNGLTPLVERIRKCYEYRQWRSDVFTRDNWTCQTCGKRGGDLEAHHLKMFSEIIKNNNILTFEDALTCSELWNINNGQTLCVDCHKIENSKQMIGNKHQKGGDIFYN